MPRAAQYLPDAGSLEGEAGVRLDVCQCSGCGLIQLDSDPVPYYREVIRATAVSEEMRDFRRCQLSDVVRECSLAGRKVLEVGCGAGEYLSILRECQVDAYGLEESAASVKRCVERGLRVSRGFVESESYEIQDGPFDAFMTFNYLEHLPAPNAVLRGIGNNLADGAVGLVEVPNFDLVIRDRVFSEFICDHLCYFTKATLVSTLQLNGFEVIRCAEIWHDYILAALVRKRGRVDLSDFFRCRAELQRNLDGYLQGYGDRRVAVWGAGHQALAVLSLTGIADRIQYVVDSAPFKQGKFTPATHIPIVSPNALDAEPVDAVIVMVAGYSDEVARIIRGRYGKRIDVAIVRGYRVDVV
jgi:SAM-dependent methyltransferase